MIKALALTRFTRFPPTLPGSLQPTDVLRHEIINSALAQNKKMKIHMSLLLSVQDNCLEVQGLASCLCANERSNHWITFQTGGEYLEGRGGKGEGADGENILCPFVMVKVGYLGCLHLPQWRRANWLAMEKCRRWRCRRVRCQHFKGGRYSAEAIAASLPFWWVLSLCSGWSGIPPKGVSNKFPQPGCCSADIAAFGSHTSGG